MGIWRRGVLIVSCAWAFLPAQASSYSDFDAGIAARNLRRCDIAEPRMTSALAAPDLLSSLRAPALMVRALCRAQDKNFDAALADLDSLLALEPDNYDAHLFRGELRVTLKRAAVAEDDFSALIRIRPDLVESRVALARYYLNQKRYDAAVAQYTALIATDPVTGYVLRSRAYVLQGDLDRALADAAYLVGIGPKQAIAYETRQAVYDARGDLEHALSDIDDAIDTSTDSPDLERQKGVVLWKLGRFSDAGAAFRRAARDDPKDGYNVMWLNLARIADGDADRDLAARAAAVDKAAWPGPLLAVYAAQSTPDAALKAAAAGDAPDLERNICEADFYVGMWQVYHDAKEAGRALLQQAVTACPADYVEGRAAAAALKRMP